MIDYQEELEQYKERIDELATQKRYAELRDLFLPMEPADIALLLEEGKQEQMPLLYRLLPKETADPSGGSDSGHRSPFSGSPARSAAG